jgi:hypothetical protein
MRYSLSWSKARWLVPELIQGLELLQPRRSEQSVRYSPEFLKIRAKAKRLGSISLRRFLITQREEKRYAQGFQPLGDQKCRVCFDIHIYNGAIEAGIYIEAGDAPWAVDRLEKHLCDIENSFRRIVQKEAVFQNEKTLTCKALKHISANVLISVQAFY